MLFQHNLSEYFPCALWPSSKLTWSNNSAAQIDNCNTLRLPKNASADIYTDTVINGEKGGVFHYKMYTLHI